MKNPIISSLLINFVFLCAPRTAFSYQVESQGQLVWPFCLILLFPVMMILTHLAGGYKIIESGRAASSYLRKWHKFNQFAVVFSGIFLMITAPFYLGVPGPSFQLVLGWALICSVPLFRGLWLVGRGIGEIKENNNNWKKASSWGFLSFGGVLVLFALGVAVLPFQDKGPPYDVPTLRAFKQVPKENLRNFYMGCQAYWYDYSEDKVCDLDKVSQPDIGFVKKGPVEIAGQGTKADFSATAKHEDSDTVYSIDSDGRIFNSGGSIKGKG